MMENDEFLGSEERAEKCVLLLSSISSKVDVLGREYAKVGDLIMTVSESDVHTTKNIIEAMTKILDYTGRMYSDFSAFQTLMEEFYEEQLKAKKTEEEK